MARTKKTEETKAAEAEKPTAKTAKAQKFDPEKVYKFEANGECPSMPKGKIYEINGHEAAHFVKMGYGKTV